MARHRHADLIHAWADEHLRYDKESGKLFWKKQRRGRSRVGTEAGRCVRGYRRVGVMGKEIQAHVLVWLIVTDEYPQSHIDHIDGDKENNRFVNLRLVTHQENQHNQRRAHKKSSTGLIGAHRNTNGGFDAKICVNNKAIYLGHFKTALGAHETYMRAKAIHHPSFIPENKHDAS